MYSWIDATIPLDFVDDFFADEPCDYDHNTPIGDRIFWHNLKYILDNQLF